MDKYVIETCPTFINIIHPRTRTKTYVASYALNKIRILLTGKTSAPWTQPLHAYHKNIPKACLARSTGCHTLDPNQPPGSPFPRPLLVALGLAVVFRLDEDCNNSERSPRTFPVRCEGAVSVCCVVEHLAAPRTIRCHAVLLKIEWQIVAMQRYEGVWEYFSRVRETFVVKVMRFGEGGASKVRCRLGIGVQI